MNAIPPFAAAWSSLPFYWHLPLMIVVISLVYSATRFDDWNHILHEAFRWGVRMTTFLLGVVAVTFVLGLLI